MILEKILPQAKPPRPPTPVKAPRPPTPVAPPAPPAPPTPPKIEKYFEGRMATTMRIIQGALGIGFVGLGIAMIPAAIVEPSPFGEALALACVYSGFSLLQGAFK